MPDVGSSRCMQPERKSTELNIKLNTFVDTSNVSTFSKNEDTRSQLPYFDIIAALPADGKSVEGVPVMALDDSGASDTAINYDLLQCMPNYNESKLINDCF